jgi:ATP/ADP translocase
MNQNNHSYKLFSFLFFFLFGGVIVGETLSLTVVVIVLGPAIISKLYLINGALLFMLPPLFFQNIDKVNRGKLLSLLLIVTAGILSFYSIIYYGLHGSIFQSGIFRFLVLVIYPLSYLSKTILFLTFWTLANDIYATEEAKKGFPIVGAWGFMGGLSGACIARLLLIKTDVMMILLLWIAAYIVGWYSSRKVTIKYRTKLLKKEKNEQSSSYSNLFKKVGSIFDIKLIRSISILYFCVFIAIFMQDYLFLKKSTTIFATSKSLAGFLFTFYLVHGIATIIGLRFAVPPMISKWGFTRIFTVLPITLFAGSLVLLIMTLFKVNGQIFFMVLITVQFIRYIVFENAFSPIYQMFFSVIPSEKRGQAKTFLEGVIKPCSIMATGAAIIVIDKIPFGLITTILIVSVIMLYIVIKLRKTYLEALVPKLGLVTAAYDVIAKIGSHHDQKLLSLIKDYSRSTQPDVRSLCVKILAQDGSRRALKLIGDLFTNEQSPAIKEAIAVSMANFTMMDAQPIMENMLRDSNCRIRANALYSLVEMDCFWKHRLGAFVRSMVLDKNPRIRIQAARYLWDLNEVGDRMLAVQILESFQSSKNAYMQSAGIYLIGAIKPVNWESVLLENLKSATLKVFENCVEAIFRFGSRQTRLKTLQIIDEMSRNHISNMGKILQKIGITAFEGLEDFLHNAQSQRMIVEVIHALRLVVERQPQKRENRGIDNKIKSAVAFFVRQDFERLYKDGYVWWRITTMTPQAAADASYAALDDALREQMIHACERSLDAMTLLDKDGMMAMARRNLDIRDFNERLDIAEIIEGMSVTGIASLIVPILRNENWEDLGKIGNSHFRFEDDAPSLRIEYFVESKNTWVSFCALYALYKLRGKRRLVETYRSIIMNMRRRPNIYLSRVVGRLLESGNEQREESMEDFELLECVMALKKTALFHATAAEKLMAVSEISHLTSFKAGTLISREGEVSDHLYIVRSGSLKIIKSKNNVKTILSILHGGEIYGEIGLFNQAPRSASAIAQEDCELWVIQRSALKKILLEMPEIAVNLLEALSYKLHKNTEALAELNAVRVNNKKEYLS